MKKLMVLAGLMAGMSAWAAEPAWVDVTPPSDLSGWTVQGGEWSVADGVVVGKGLKDAVGALISDAVIVDFELEVEFKVANSASGGVMVRAHALPKLPLAEGSDPLQAEKVLYGYQVVLEPSQPGNTGAVSDPNGRGAIAAPRTEAGARVKPTDWNRLGVKAMGNELMVSVNGVSAVTGTDMGYTKGRLALVAAPGSEVQFRNLRIKDHGRAGNWRALFNGKNLDGWIEWGEEKWDVEDGVIAGRSGPKRSEGYLATADTWKDFHVRGVYKMLGEGNYGLFYHSTIAYDDKHYPVISGVQGEVAPGYPSNTGFVYESYKRGWLVKPDMSIPGAYAQRPDDWNEIEIKSEGNRITTWVNGVNVVDWTDAVPNLVEGAFALQLHTGGVHGILWKDLYVEE